MPKRLFDVFFAALGLAVVLPLWVVIAIAIKAGDGGSVFFRQKRVGWQGQPFWILKFRTMVPNAEKMGHGVTQSGDPRVTAIGKWLRKTKLDELPQLWNVLVGEMSFVGPRPEVPQYVERYTEAQRKVLQLKPGITDWATLQYRNEEEVLKGAEDVESFYLEKIVPRKIALNLAYASSANVWEDTKIILRTLLPALALPLRVERSALPNLYSESKP